MEFCGVALSYEATGITARCTVKACAFPGRGVAVYDHWRGSVKREVWCWWHFMANCSPLSMEYQDADALCRHESNRGQQIITHEPPHQRILRSYVRVVRAEDEQPSATPVTHLRDSTYSTIGQRFYSACGEKFVAALACADGQAPTCQACRRIYLAIARDALSAPARPMPGRPNLHSLYAPSVPVNRQQTGAFVLWKGFGKKKIRKSQRPAGWHGNHPDQKPVKRWSRESLDDIPQWAPPVRIEKIASSEPWPEVEISIDEYRERAAASMTNVDFEVAFGAGS